MMPKISPHYSKRRPSSIRMAQIEFQKRPDQKSLQCINTAIGNVSLPMHPLLQKRMQEMGSPTSPFASGVVKYSATVGMPEAISALKNILASSGIDTEGQNIYTQITDGGSHAMELAILGVTGDAASEDSPLLLIDAAYTNYTAFAKRLSRPTISFSRQLQDDGLFALPNFAEIEKLISKHRPGAIVVIPYDNPTGQFYNQKTLNSLAALAVKYNLWIISDEAYRELHYTGEPASSIWKVTEQDVPGITGRRMSIETASKVWNACGLRIGALCTDNFTMHEKAVAEQTANLCSNTLGQYIFGALKDADHTSLHRWYQQQRTYYGQMMKNFFDEMKNVLPLAITSRPDAALYSVIDFRKMVPENFDTQDFVVFCAQKGSVLLDGVAHTLLTAPMADFYNVSDDGPNPGSKQVRVAFVESPQVMSKVPLLLKKLLEQYSRHVSMEL